MVWLCTMWGYEEKRLPRHKARLFRFRYRNRRSTGEILFYGYYTPDGGEWSRKIFRQGECGGHRRQNRRQRRPAPRGGAGKERDGQRPSGRKRAGIAAWTAGGGLRSTIPAWSSAGTATRSSCQHCQKAHYERVCRTDAAAGGKRPCENHKGVRWGVRLSIKYASDELERVQREDARLCRASQSAGKQHIRPLGGGQEEPCRGVGFDYYKTVFIVDGKVFEGLINIANSENGRVFYDITNIEEVPDYTRKYAAPLARSSSTFGNLSMATIRQTEGNRQEKSSGKASVEVSGINNRTAAELGDVDTVFADGSISALSEERKITPETSEEARYEILKDRTIRPASVEYDKLGDTDTAAIYDGLSAAQMAQAKKAIRAIAKKLGLNQVDLKNSRIEFPFRFSNANADVSAQHQSEYGGLYMTVAMTKIKESDVVKKLQAGESAAATSLLSDSNISIQDIFRSVKAGDGRFLKYAPDAFLNDAQNAAKRRAIQRQTGEGASYKIDGNGRASVEVKNRNTETSEEDARRDFSPAGEPPRVHLAADSFCSITHALMPQKLRLRRNRSAFFCPRQRQTAFPSVQILSRKAYTKKDSLPHRAGNPFWYARRDLNPRPLAPEANTLSS